MENIESTPTPMNPAALAAAWRVLARRDGGPDGIKACALIDALADARALQSTFEAAEASEPDTWDGLAELRSVCAADTHEIAGRGYDCRLLIFAAAGSATAIDALPRDGSAWRALQDSLDGSGLFRSDAAVVLMPASLDPVGLATMPLDDVRDLARAMGRWALAEMPWQRDAARQTIDRILGPSRPVEESGEVVSQTVRAFIGVRCMPDGPHDPVGDVLDPGDGYDEAHASLLASAWQDEAFVAVGDRGIDVFSVPAPWEDGFMVCGVTQATLWISAEEELDIGVLDDDDATVHACPHPDDYGLLVSRVRHGHVAGPAFVPGCLLHTRIVEFLDLLGTEARPTVRHEDASTLPVRNGGRKPH